MRANKLSLCLVLAAAACSQASVPAGRPSQDDGATPTTPGDPSSSPSPSPGSSPQIPPTPASPPSGGDDTQVLQSLLDAGFVVGLSPGATYRISSTLEITQDHSGIVTVGAPATIVLTSSFSNDDPFRLFELGTINAVGIRAHSRSDLRFENFKIEREHSDGTYVTGLWLRDVASSVVSDLELWGFSLGAMLALDSVRAVVVRGCTFRDSWAGTVSSDPAKRKFPQLTAVVVDDSKFVVDGQPVGSRDLSISGNTIARLRFSRALYEMPRSAFLGFSGNPALVGYQTDGINIIPGGERMTLSGNHIDTVGEGIDTMAARVRIEDNTVLNSFDFGIKLVHGASETDVRRNLVDGAGSANIVVAGSTLSSVGNSFGNVFVGNQLSRVGARDAFCGATAAPGFSVQDCDTDAAASAMLVTPNGGVQLPYYNLFFDNRVVAVPSDVRMGALIRVDENVISSLFYANSFSDGTGRAIGNSVASIVGTVIDSRAWRLAEGDFDGNGTIDVFLHVPESGQNIVYYKEPDRSMHGAINPIAPTAINSLPDVTHVGDTNTDGIADLSFEWTGQSLVRTFFGTGAQTFVGP